MVSNLSGMLYRQYIKERSAMTTSKKEFNASLKKAKDWDGRSRPSDDAYRESWNRIFGKKEIDELAESHKQSKLNKKEREK